MDFNDVMDNPKKFGLPTLEEYSKNPEYWRRKLFGGRDHLFDAIDKGSKHLSGYVISHIYELDGYRCKGLEEVESVARSQGLDPWSMRFTVEVLDRGGKKCDLLVQFTSKPALKTAR